MASIINNIMNRSADSSFSQSTIEEVLNSAIHGIGTVAAIIGLIVGLNTLDGPLGFVISFSVYGISLILLMLSSTLYHALFFTRARDIFQILDHVGIYLLIAGTFTPFAVFFYEGWAMTFILLAMWLLTVTGITLHVIFPKIMKRFMNGIFVALGWLALLFVPPLLDHNNSSVWKLALAGGVLYTLGAALLLLKKPFIHMVWHVLVILAASAHCFAITALY